MGKGKQGEKRGVEVERLMRLIHNRCGGTALLEAWGQFTQHGVIKENQGWRPVFKLHCTGLTDCHPIGLLDNQRTLSTNKW